MAYAAWDDEQEQYAPASRQHVQVRVRLGAEPPIHRNLIARAIMRKWGGRFGACWADGLTGVVVLGWEDAQVAVEDAGDMDSLIWEVVERAMASAGGRGRNYQVDVWGYGWLRSSTPRSRPPGWAARSNW
jgi:hypothetical protein